MIGGQLLPFKGKPTLSYLIWCLNDYTLRISSPSGKCTIAIVGCHSGQRLVVISHELLAHREYILNVYHGPPAVDRRFLL